MNKSFFFLPSNPLDIDYLLPIKQDVHLPIIFTKLTSFSNRAKKMGVAKENEVVNRFLGSRSNELGVKKV